LDSYRGKEHIIEKIEIVISKQDKEKIKEEARKKKEENKNTLT